jgi:putative phosphoribosyl transferase
MVFRDRFDAGVLLGREIVDVAPDLLDRRSVVLAIPRGGVVVGVPVARALGAPLDVVIPRKLGAPGNPELGVGAVAPGVRVIDRAIVNALAVSEGHLERETRMQLTEIERRSAQYRAGRPPLDLRETAAVIVDDGVATGVTAVAALRWARAQGAEATIFAAPVGPRGICDRFAVECDRCVVLETPKNLRAVGQWYEVFDQTTDDEVRAALDEVSS